jgi:glucose/arabinose dehydrogenase
MSWLESGREMAWSGWRVGKTTWRRSVAVGVLAVAMVAAILAPTRQAVALPAGFHEHVVFTGLNQPTNLEFAQDGRVFVAEQSGVIKVYDNLVDRTATVFADLSTVVHKQADRGLLGLALPPRFPVTPWVYVFYTYDAPPGQTAPVYNDVCAEPTGGNCVVTSRLSRLPITADGSAGAEQVLIHDFCQQYPSHSVGDLRFGADGALYVSSGDGAHFFATDWGQFGTPRNPCGDAPGGVGGAMDPPTAEGGALRAQDVRTTADPTALNGSVLRLNPETGEAMAGNPLIGSADPNARRVVAHGLRNPFRMAVRPGTGELWIADVGWDTWESVERLARPTAKVTNFGWPCYEGPDRTADYDNANLNLCESLYSGTGQTEPYYNYNHANQVVPGEDCSTGASSIGGLAFYPTRGGHYPHAYAGALFFTDTIRKCIWAMRPGKPGGLPDTTRIETFATGLATPVDLEIGPRGELYYLDFGGTVRRIGY